MVWNYPVTLDSKEPFCTDAAPPLSFTVRGFLIPLFALAMIIPMRWSQETKTGY